MIDAFRRVRRASSRSSPQRERHLQAAARPQRHVGAQAWPSIPKSPTRSWQAFIASYDIGALASCKGIAEGVENPTICSTPRTGAHPDALREAGGRGRPAVLPRPDGASGGARHFLPDADPRPRGPQSARAGRAAGGADQLSRRHLGAARRRPSNARASAQALGAPASGRRRLPLAPRQRPVAGRLGAAVAAIAARADS